MNTDRVTNKHGRERRSPRRLALLLAFAPAPLLAQQSGYTATNVDTDSDIIVVTAQKRSQKPMDVPISMTVIGTNDLEKTHGKTLQDIQQLIPNFSFDEQSGFNAITMRGIGGGGRNIGFDPRVGVYVDGVYMGQAQALRQPLFNIERIEFLNGPQGHLFGRNTVAGAVNITTAAPSRQFESTFRSGIGNYGSREGSATISGPISDRLLGTFSFGGETRAGYGLNLYDGQKIEDLNHHTVRGQLVALVNDRLKVSLSVDASQSRLRQLGGEPTSDMFQQPLIGGRLPKYTINVDRTPTEAMALSGANLTTNYVLENGHKLTAILGYRETRQDKRMDNDYSPSDLLSTDYTDRFRQTSEEIRVTSPESGDVRSVIGYYHLREAARTSRDAFIGRDVDTTLVQFIGAPSLLPFGPTLGLQAGTVVSNRGTITTDTHALFGSLDYKVFPSLTLNLGARYTRETKNVLFNLDGTASGAFDIGTLQDYRDTRSENKLSPTIGATYALTPSQNVYAKYSRGFKSGGWNVEFLGSGAARNPSFNTERVDSYEAGTKGKLLGGDLRYSVAAYTSRYKDYQVFQFVDLGAGGTSIELRNAAEAISRGMETDIALRATRRLNVGLRFGLVKAYFAKFANCSQSVNCSGHRLPYSPGFTAALTANYAMPLPNAAGTLDIYGEYTQRGKSYADPVNDPATQSVPGRNQANIWIGYTPPGTRWEFSFFARNLFGNSTVIARDRDFLGNLIDMRMAPRLIGLAARFDI